MNKLPSSHCDACSFIRAIVFFLLVALPSPSIAQTPLAARSIVVPAARPDEPGLFLALSPKEALSQRQMLAGDNRLDRLVTLDVISVPLDELLRKESIGNSADAKQGADKLILAASHNCEALKLQIRLNHRPLRALMTALAEMLPGLWTKTPDGYNLSLTDKAVLARAEWWRLFLGEREKALALQRQAVLTAMQTKARRRQANDPEPEPSDHAAEEETADQHDFFHTLPPALKQQIAANMEETAFYEVGQIGFGNAGEQIGTIGWLSQMSPETQKRFKATLQDNMRRMNRERSVYASQVVQAEKDMAILDLSRVYFLFQNGGINVFATPFNCPSSVSTPLNLDVPAPVSLPVLTLDQTQLAGEVYGGAEMPIRWKQLAETLRKTGAATTPDQKRLIYDVYGMGEAAPLEWKQLAAYQRGRVWPNLLPKLPREDQSVWHPQISRAAQTDWLGERGGMEYVCDYYSHGGSTMPEAQRKMPLRRPLAAELDEMAARRDVSWKKDADGVYLVRNNRWYRDDGLEVPQPLLRRWFGALIQARQKEAAAQAAVPVVPQTPEERAAALRQSWDWAAEVFSTLTPWQIRNGLTLFQPEEKDLAPQNDASAAKLFQGGKRPGSQGIAPPGFDAFAEMTRMPPFSMAVNVLKGYPHTVHLYGSLDDAERTALLEGQLAASSLNGSQLAEAASLLPQLPQAMQSFPADSVRLSLPGAWQSSDRAVFGAVPPRPLEIFTPPPPDAAPSPTPGE